MSTTLTSNMRKLPVVCYARMDGDPVLIRRGNSEPEPVALSGEQMAWRNHVQSVTPQQVQAMICGVTFGWDHRSADPDSHSATPMPLHHMEVSIPITVTIPVEAYSTEDAIREACSKLVLPEGFIIDGRPLITRKH